jgi:hypothetical protein
MSDLLLATVGTHTHTHTCPKRVKNGAMWESMLLADLTFVWKPLWLRAKPSLFFSFAPFFHSFVRSFWRRLYSFRGNAATLPCCHAKMRSLTFPLARTYTFVPISSTVSLFDLNTHAALNPTLYLPT